MGVYYKAQYGIGIQVEPIDFEDENLSNEIAEIECMSDFLFDKIEDKRFDFFEVGDWMYSGKENEYYIEIVEPFENGILGLVEKEKDLREYIEYLGLKTIGGFGVIGGLLIH